MRVLIISLPRTGSTSLLYKIAKERNLVPLFEPFDSSNRVLYKGQNDIVLKTIICHHPNNLELSKEFDEIILLSRKNLNDCIESHAYQKYFSRTKGYNSNNHYEFTSPPIEVLNSCASDILNWNEDLLQLSEELKIPITYYEDLFDENGVDRLRIIHKNSKNII
jgi:hypothetical protein